MEKHTDRILELKSIYYSYHNADGETPAITDLSFSVNESEFIAIVGPSGCGKSTLLSLISGLIKPERGLIKINGRSLRESAANIGYMLQHDQLFEWRTIYHNVLLGLEIQHTLSARTREKAHELLDTYGLKQFENSRPSELSGGMRQRAALVRTLILEPDILLLDEPTRGVDVGAKAEIYKIINDLATVGLSIIVVSSEMTELLGLSDRILVMHEGYLSGELMRGEATEETIMHMSISHDKTANA